MEGWRVSVQSLLAMGRTCLLSLGGQNSPRLSSFDQLWPDGTNEGMGIQAWEGWLPHDWRHWMKSASLKQIRTRNEEKRKGVKGEIQKGKRWRKKYWTILMVINTVIFSSPCNGITWVGNCPHSQAGGNSSALHQTPSLGCSWSIWTHTQAICILSAFFSLSHPKVKNTKVKSGDMDSQYHFPKVKMLVKKKSFFSKDSTDLYTIPNQSKKVLGGLP